MSGESAAGGQRSCTPEERGVERARVHPAWASFIRYCAQLGHGQIDQLKIQDGVPVLAEIVTRKIKFP